jgi:HlyD family secretion protein
MKEHSRRSRWVYVAVVGLALPGGLPVRTTVKSLPGKSFEGTVTRIAPMGRELDNVTTFDVRVSIANPQGKLRVAMSANAEIVLEDRENVLLIPEAALVRDKEGKPFVQQRDASAKAGFRKVQSEFAVDGCRGGIVESGRLAPRCKRQ